MLLCSYGLAGLLLFFQITLSLNLFLGNDDSVEVHTLSQKAAVDVQNCTAIHRFRASTVIFKRKCIIVVFI